MTMISIAAVPNQSLSAQLSEGIFNITLRTSGYDILVDISINGELMILGLRAHINKKLLPYPHMEKFGNLVLWGKGDLNYSGFGTSVLLFHIPPEEL